MSHRPNRRPLVRALVESNRRMLRQNRIMTAAAAKPPKRTKEQRRLDRLVDEQLDAMGVKARALAVADEMRTPEFQLAFAAARAVHGPFVGAEGYGRLRAVMLAVLADRGCDTTGVTLRFFWDAVKTLRADVVATPEAQQAAEAAVREQLEAAVTP